ncbi:unnamed protein product [Rotaria magnacalcarata]|uniref:Uncharacterized protein n=1 Tax=Rotaria magnacalcarata TaxID=392030 RepID=A0A816UHI0_9BILA|nr:unnamed protein product [Rotaria magnacalcarata]CAF1352385.1 unnamed protein product [Rotaria magnacalcarata]CAF2034086.1 unnamed protein product [Rotaria magnacalcarata]CAF2112023.1 unnamed protein product [Rotaria magnacalcarata]CAF2224818.1 unnamed protein product [Rotaria magnacalcarata]
MFAHRNISLYGGHDDEINCLVFSKDFEILLTASINGFIRLWNTVFDHLTFKLKEKSGFIRALAISNNDRYFASTANDTNVRLYETRTGSLIYTLSGHTHSSDCLHFSADNQLIGSGGWDSRTILWNVITGEKVYDFHHHTSAVQSISFHSKLNLMATGSHDHVVFLYDLDNRSASQPVMLRGHFGNVRALAFSTLPYLASAGWDKIIVIWQLETNRVRTRLFGHAGWIQAITFRDDDGSILASTDDDTVRVWNIFSNDCLHRLSIVNDLSCCVRFLPKNRGVIVGGAVYELLASQWISPRERKRTKCVREPVTGETVLMSRQKTFLPRQPRRDMSVKLPTVKPRPTTQQSILRKRITIE